MSNVVPDGWITGKLKEFALLTKGLTYASSDYSDEHNGLPFLTLKSISKDGGYSPKGLKFYKGEFKEHHVLNFGDVLFANTDLTRNGDVVGSPLFFDGFGFSDQTLYSMDLSKLKVDPSNTDAKFLYFLLMTHRVKRWMVNSSAGSTVLHLDTKRVKEIILNLPPLPEQKKIASILTSVDEVIENTQKQIDKLQDLKKATMNELLTKGIGHTEFKDSELGRIPKSWEVYALSEIGTFSKGRGISKKETLPEGVPCLRYAEIYTVYDFHIKTFKSFISPITAESSRKLIKNEIIFAGSGETVEDIGKSVAFTLDCDAYVGGDSVVFSPRSGLDSIFLSYQLNDNIRRRMLRKLGQGSSVIHIYSSGLQEVLVSLPPLSEQEKIASILISMGEAIEEKLKESRKLQSLKKSLMQDLLTGKVRVTVN